jgi:hypothetical protein
LWREQHPLGHEQTAPDFKVNFPAGKRVHLFREFAPHEATPEDISRHSNLQNGTPYKKRRSMGVAPFFI